MIKKIKKNKLACLSIFLLAVFYLSALFAGFLSVYHYDDEARDFSYSPPAKIHIYDRKTQQVGLFVYGLESEFDSYYKRIYKEKEDIKYPIKFFVKGHEYKILGLFKSTRHLLGVDVPGRFYLWGADARGRDVFSRILYGARVSLSIGLFGALISFFLGMLIGGLAGYFGGKVDTILMRLCEVFMLAPGFYLMLALRSALPPTLSSTQIYFFIVIIMSFIGWAGIARIIRGMALSLRERDFVLVAKTQGLPHIKIIFKHIIPHTFSYAIVAIALSIPGYILGEAGLSFIGLGIQDPEPSWGNLLSDAMNIIRINLYPWVIIPGILIFITVICFNILGEALRDAFDTRESYE